MPGGSSYTVQRKSAELNGGTVTGRPPAINPNEPVVAINTSNGAVTPAGTYGQGQARAKAIADKQAADRAAAANETAQTAPGADAAHAREVQQQLLNEYTSQQPRPAPVVGGATTAPVTPAVAPTVGASAAGPSTAVGGAAQTTMPRDVTAMAVRPADANPASTYSAAPVVLAHEANAAMAPGAQLDKNPQEQIRAHQLALLNSLEGSATGVTTVNGVATPTGPSAADAQMTKGIDRAISTQRSLAAGARGTGRVAAQLGAGRNIASITGQGAADAAIQKQKEVETARAQLLQGLEGTRGADIGVAGQDASLSNAAQLQNAQLQTTTNISNADREAARNLKDAELRTAAAAGNAAAQNELNLRLAGFQQEANIENSRLDLAAKQGNQGTQATVGMSNTQAQNRMTELQAQIASQEGIATQAQQNEMTRLQATLSKATGLANLGESGATSRAQLSADVQRNIAQMDSDLRARGLDDAQRKSLLDAYVTQQNALIGASSATNTANINRWTAIDVARMNQPSLAEKVVGGIFNTVGAAAPAAISKISDERQKKDIKPLLDHYAGGGGGGGDEIDQLLSKLHPYTFEYKNPDLPGAGHGRQTGVMAQDLEKSEAGRQMIIDEGGMKKIDPTQAVGTLLAAMTVMNRKMKALKGARV